ncbi:MAG: Ig-like domain-containing protein, partial [Thermoplasmatota archaeon]
MDLKNRWTGSKMSKRASSIVLVMLLASTGLMMISPVSEGSVTPASPIGLIVSNQKIHENSTAVPVWGFRATSDTGSDTLDQVNVTLVNRGSFLMSDLRTVTSNMSNSGVALYRDDGSSNDNLDADDTPLTIASFFVTGTTVVFNISSETVPTTTSGSHHWFIVIRTSSTISRADRFLVRLEAQAIRFSDNTRIPSSRSETNSIECEYIFGKFVGGTSVVPIGEEGVDGDTVAVQGLSLFTGRSNLETISSLTIDLMPISGFDPAVDLSPLALNGTSGVKLYVDDGPTSADSFNPSEDTLVVPSSVSMTSMGMYWRVKMEMYTSGSNAVWLPAASVGSYDLFVVVSSSSGLGHGNRFYTLLPSLGVGLHGVDGNNVSVMPALNRSRELRADTRAPDLSGATMTIFSDSGHFYAKDTNLQGTDTVFYNSISGEGLNQRISTIFSGYTEDFPDKLMGEPAFNYRPSGPVDDGDTTTQSLTYRIDANGYVDNPLTYTIRDKVGHETTWDVYYVKDNSPPVITNVTIRDSSPFIYAEQASRDIYFRPIMLSTQKFHLTGNAYEPGNESGLNKVTFTQEGSLTSSPSDDLTPAEWNGSYGVNSLAQDWNSPIYVTIYDKVLNDWIIDFSYHRVTTLPDVEIIAPTGNGVNVSGIYRVTARVNSDSPVSKMEFSFGTSTYREMTYIGTAGDWDTYVYDWDTYESNEGAVTIKVKATDSISGVNYNSTWVNVNNYPLWGFFSSPTWNRAVSGEIQARARVSNYCSNAMFYVGNQLVGSWSTPPSNGFIWTNVNTALFSDGNYILKAYLQGFGGRSLDLSIPITIDNTVPVISGMKVVYPGIQEAAKVGDKVRLMATIYDNTSGLSENYVVANSIGGLVYQELFDDGAHADGSKGDTNFGSEVVVVDAAWGYHVIRFMATDRAGNTIEKKVDVPVDTKPPFVEDAWVQYPGDQQAAKTDDQVRVMARISDNTAPIYVTLILDNSGSMGGTKIESLKKAAKTFINSTRSIDYVSLWRFYEDGESPHPGGRPGWPKKILNFTMMNSTGKAEARMMIDSIQPLSGTPIWDTIGNATKYTIQNAMSSPVVVAFTDGADDYYYEYPNATHEEGSGHFAPWHQWGSVQYVNYHWGKYADNGRRIENGSWVYNRTDRYRWVRSPIREWREGLLDIPIPVYTIGLGLEHHDPPNRPRRTTAPSNYEYDQINATWTGEYGTTEYNLWRIATTSAGGSYYYAPSATQLETIYRNIARSIYSTDNPAKIIKAIGNVPLDVTKQVLLFDDGLHNDGLADDGLYGSTIVEIPTLKSSERIVLIEIYDWANNIGLGEADLIIDNILPQVQTPVRVHYPNNRSSVADDEPFHMEIRAWDKGSDIFSVEADGMNIGFFPPITFNNTGEGNDLDEMDMNYTSIDVFPNTGGAPSKYYFVEIIITDMAGNSIKALAQVLVVNDKYAPVVEMIDPVNNGALSRKDRIYSLVTDDGVIATDPLGVESAPLYREAIRAVTDQPVKYVIYSHSHWD